MKSDRAARHVYCEIDGLPVEVDMNELSTAGLFVNTPTPPDEGAEIEVFLRLANIAWSAPGHVVQVVSCERAAEEARRPGFGVLFSGVDDVERVRLRHAIELVRKELAAKRAGSSRPPRPSDQAKVRASLQPAAARQPSAAPRSRKSSKPPQVRQERQERREQNDRGEQRPDAARITESRRPVSQSIPANDIVPAAPAAALTPETAALLDKLKLELASLAQKPAWEVLGISQSSDDKTAKAAFLEASKKYHPHVYSRYGAAELSQVVTELFIAKKRAYTTFSKTKAARNPAERSVGSDRAERPQPMAAEDAGRNDRRTPPEIAAPSALKRSAIGVTAPNAPNTPSAPSAPANEVVAPSALRRSAIGVTAPTVNAEISAPSALRRSSSGMAAPVAAPANEVALPNPARRSGGPSPAPSSQERERRPAPTMRPAHGDEKKARAAEVEMLMTAALKRIVATHIDAAEADLNKALALDPECMPARIWLLTLAARRFKGEGDQPAALEKYLEILALDPKHHEALGETRKHAKDTRDKPGLLGRFFGSGNK